jgi:hypothetical protein
VCSPAGGRACPGLSSFFRLGPRSSGSAAVGRRAEALRHGATKPPARYISKIVFSVVFALFATGTPTRGVRIQETHRCPATAGPALARECHRPLRRDVPQADWAIRPRDGDEEGHTGSSDRTCRPTTDPARTGDRTAVSTVRGPPTYRTRAMRQAPGLVDLDLRLACRCVTTIPATCRRACRPSCRCASRAACHKTCCGRR